jgi:hypothetical protein
MPMRVNHPKPGDKQVVTRPVVYMRIGDETRWCERVIYEQEWREVPGFFYADYFRWVPIRFLEHDRQL